MPRTRALTEEGVMARRRRSFGLIRKRGKQYYARWTERGREKEVRVGPTWDLADRFLARKAVELGMERASGVRPVAPVKFTDLLERYEAIFAGEKRSTTLAREGAYLRSKALPHFEGQRVDEVRREDIERFLIQRAESDKVGAATRNRMLNILSAFFWKAVALNHARENPCKDVPRKKEELRDCPFLAPEDQEKLIACTPEAMRPVVGLALDTGLRTGELLRLEWRDVDFKGGTVRVRVSKSGKGRSVPFTARGRRALDAAWSGRPAGQQVPDLVFRGVGAFKVSGEPCFLSEARLMWVGAREKAGFPELRFHDLRHVYGATMARAGVPLGELREFMGHSTLSMVLRYARHAPANSPETARARMEAYLIRGY